MNTGGRPELSPGATARRHFEDEGFTLEGVSVAGVATWLTIGQWSLAIDCGVVTPQVVRCRTLALTHGHMDHAGGLATWLAMRRLNGLGSSTVYAPASAVGALRKVVETWESLHRHPFDWQLIGLEPGDRVPIRGDLTLEALPADHVVPCLGWAVWRTKHRLLRSLQGASGPEIKAAKLRGEAITQRADELLFALSGDSRATMVHDVPQLRQARVSCMETTFLDKRCSIAQAQLGGHTHLDELLDVPWQVKTLVPYHISQRYNGDVARRILTAKLGGVVQDVWPLLPESE
ncbi:MAG: hypothetical protein KC502_15355 [Myxococcales bacterium]|nr:hypothetical protein [Myxococcales bacterium]